MIRRLSPRVLEVILLTGIVSIAGFFLREQRVLPLHTVSNSKSAAVDFSIDDVDINVDVTPRNRSDWNLEIAGKFRIRSATDDKVEYAGDHLRQTRILRHNNHWRFDPAPTGVKSSADNLEILPATGETFRLDKHRYRGSLLLTRTGSGRPLLVNRIGLEEYVASVVDGEMPLEFGREARCAQAVIARSYVLYQAQQAKLKRLPYDVHADTRSQFYPGFQYQGTNGVWYAGESVEGRACAELTRGLVCADRGRLMCTYYSASCGGRTCRGTDLFPDASPLLTGVACEHCGDAPLYRWERSIRLTRFQTSLQNFLRGKGAGTLDWKSWNDVRASGRLPLFRVSDNSNSYSVSGFDLRNLWGGELLPSPIMEIELGEKQVVIRGAGHGHGVGLCQWGARGLAARGKPFLEILKYYYPGVEVVPYGKLEGAPSIAVGNGASRNGSQVKSPR